MTSEGGNNEYSYALRTFAPMEDMSKSGFSGNAIRTTKYTLATFVFLNLWEQFQKLANVYFLLISILQFIPIVSSMTPTSWIPLSFVLTVNMVKEGIEDHRRAGMDKEINGKEVQSVQPDGKVCTLPWKDVEVGSVLLLKEDKELPCDVIVLASSDTTAGLCYIETANLDGETNLKNRESIEEVQNGMDAFGPLSAESDKVDRQMVDFIAGIKVECEKPNENLNNFTGSLSHSSWDSKVGVTNKQVVYRGCTMRNTKWIFGLTVFTGMETKLMMNACEKRLKRTSLDRLTNKYLIGVFGLLGAVCILGGLLSGIWIATTEVTPWYIHDLGTLGSETFLNMVTFLILLSALIPISLTVTMEMVKVGHAYFINQDATMCYQDPMSDIVTPARARTSNLSEDLGRIEYIFSDKTGTLTQNVMEFMKCSIGGTAYGTGITEIGRQNALREGRKVEEVPRPADLKLERGNNFYDPMITGGGWRKTPRAQEIETFFAHLAVCHTVMAKPRVGQESDASAWRPDNMVYQASSPDEEALVIGAKGAGFWFKRRTFEGVHVQVEGEKEPRLYPILNTCEFNSTRKRMSVVTKSPTGQYLLLTKGADTVMYERLARGATHQAETKEHMCGFANEGLRTLVLGYREVEQKEYEQWNKAYRKANISTTDREAQMDAVAEQIEVNLHLLGATAIEDKLQDGVPGVIKTLGEANINIWVLTGDKVETAINIAMACNLINTAMHLERVSLPDPPPMDDPEDKRRMNDDRASNTLNQLRQAYQNLSGIDAEKRKVGLVIDGYSLQFALNEEQEVGKRLGELMTFAQRCQSVVCCRVSPKQKADVVELVRSKMSVTTLAIGDGANDVGMIMKAHIGVGISGREGVQAVMASDYAVAQFRYLQQLVLVHGRWDFQRVSVVILYFFYKNVAFALVSFWYGIHSGFSAVSFWDDYYQSVWNVIFTSVPILAVSLFDKDVKYQATIHHFPHLYVDVQSGQDFTGTKFAAWTIEAFLVSLIVYFIPLMVIHPDPAEPDGIDSGKWLFSFTVFSVCHTVCNLRLALVTKTWNVVTTGFTILSVLSYWIFSLAFTNFPPSFVAEMYHMFAMAFTHNRLWHSLFLCSVIALLPPFTHIVLQKTFWPTATERVAQLEAKVIREIRGTKTDTRSSQVAPSDSVTTGHVTEADMDHRLSSEFGQNGDVQSSPSNTQRKTLVIEDVEGNAEEYMGFSFSKGSDADPEVPRGKDPPYNRGVSRRLHKSRSQQEPSQSAVTSTPLQPIEDGATGKS